MGLFSKKKSDEQTSRPKLSTSQTQPNPSSSSSAASSSNGKLWKGSRSKSSADIAPIVTPYPPPVLTLPPLSSLSLGAAFGRARTNNFEDDSLKIASMFSRSHSSFGDSLLPEIIGSPTSSRSPNARGTTSSAPDGAELRGVLDPRVHGGRVRGGSGKLGGGLGREADAALLADRKRRLLAQQANGGDESKSIRGKKSSRAARSTLDDGMEEFGRILGTDRGGRGGRAATEVGASSVDGSLPYLSLPSSSSRTMKRSLVLPSIPRPPTPPPPSPERINFKLLDVKASSPAPPQIVPFSIPTTLEPPLAYETSSAGHTPFQNSPTADHFNSSTTSNPLPSISTPQVAATSSSSNHPRQASPTLSAFEVVPAWKAAQEAIRRRGESISVSQPNVIPSRQTDSPAPLEPLPTPQTSRRPSLAGAAAPPLPGKSSARSRSSSISRSRSSSISEARVDPPSARPPLPSIPSSKKPLSTLPSPKLSPSIEEDTNLPSPLLPSHPVRRESQVSSIASTTSSPAFHRPSLPARSTDHSAHSHTSSINSYYTSSIPVAPTPLHTSPYLRQLSPEQFAERQYIDLGLEGELVPPVKPESLGGKVIRKMASWSRAGSTEDIPTVMPRKSSLGSVMTHSDSSLEFDPFGSLGITASLLPALSTASRRVISSSKPSGRPKTPVPPQAPLPPTNELPPNPIELKEGQNRGRSGSLGRLPVPKPSTAPVGLMPRPFGQTAALRPSSSREKMRKEPVQQGPMTPPRSQPTLEDVQPSTPRAAQLRPSPSLQTPPDTPKPIEPQRASEPSPLSPLQPNPTRISANLRNEMPLSPNASPTDHGSSNVDHALFSAGSSVTNFSSAHHSVVTYAPSKPAVIPPVATFSPPVSEGPPSSFPKLNPTSSAKLRPPRPKKTVSVHLASILNTSQYPRSSTGVKLLELIALAPTFAALLSSLSFPEWLNLYSSTRAIRRLIGLDRELREVLLDRYLAHVGWKPWDEQAWGKEVLPLTPNDLNAFLRCSSIPLPKLAAHAQAIFSGSDRSPTTVPLLQALTRHHSRIVMRLRLQATAQVESAALENKASGRREAVGVVGRSRSSSIRSLSINSTAIDFRSPLFRVNHAAMLRVFVPSREGAWLSDNSVVACEEECKKAGIWTHLRVGDIVADTAVLDSGNAGCLIFDGNYLVDLDYAFSVVGEIPPSINAFAYPPSYWHKVIKSIPSPLLHLDLSGPFGVELKQSTTLIHDHVPRSSSPPLTLHPNHSAPSHQPRTSAYRSVLQLRPSSQIQADWAGSLVVVTHATAEALADLGKRFITPTRTPFRLMREFSRPGEIWIRPVGESERLRPAA